MSKLKNENTLASTLRHFDITEVNLSKLEKLNKEILQSIPKGIVYKTDEVYEDKCRAFKIILDCLPTINGWKPNALPLELNNIAQGRQDIEEVEEINIALSLQNEIEKPSLELREYRFRLNQKRKELVRSALLELIDSIDDHIRTIESKFSPSARIGESISGAHWDELENYIKQIDTLLGSATKRPKRWSDMYRHLSFGQYGDFHDIKEMDWPDIKSFLQQNMYGTTEPIPTDIKDLSELVNKMPKGPVTAKLQWHRITSEQFERLIFSLISTAEGYENAQWLTKTNAPDRGRDLSVDRVLHDPLAGVLRSRVIIQCKHWLESSISISEITSLQAQMKLWEPPKVDIHIIATSGRFTSDAVDLIEKNNNSDRALKIEMWPESHLEMLLASRPALIVEFGLR